jgi:DNA-binding FadR family transcriptional regulator
MQSHQAVAAALLQGINRDKLSPGDKLPSVASLAVRYRVPVSTIRAALDTLRTQGIVITRPGTTATVSHTRPTRKPAPHPAPVWITPDTLNILAAFAASHGLTTDAMTERLIRDHHRQCTSPGCHRPTREDH